MKLYTFEELHAFPVDTILRDHNGNLWRKYSDRLWYTRDWVLSSYQLELGGYLLEEVMK